MALTIAVKKGLNHILLVERKNVKLMIGSQNRRQ